MKEYSDLQFITFYIYLYYTEFSPKRTYLMIKLMDFLDKVQTLWIWCLQHVP